MSSLTAIDANLRAIRAFEGSSTLPSIPSEVTLDLAGTTAMTPDGVKQLFLGLQSDIESAGATEALPVAQPDIWTPLGSDYERGPELGRLIYGTTGSGRVETYSNQAVQQWKQRAVDRGYLDLSPAQVQDPRWLPEYSSVAGEMLRDQSKREFAGDRPGSMSVDTVMNLVEEWLSPKGLYRAAMEMDLMWDFGAIGRETDTWLEKWHSWSEEPWNPGRLIDAVTGPLDDIMFPVINWALMFVGVGEVFNTIRFGIKGVQAGAMASKAIAGIGAGSKGVQYANRVANLVPGANRALVATDRAADIAFFKNQSFTANLLKAPTGNATGPIASSLDAFRGTKAVGAARDQLGAWRNLTGVVAAKKANQQILRLGFNSNLQALVDDERGRSLASETRIDDAVNAVMENPAAEWAVDLLLYPPNLFERGTLKAAALGAGRVAGRVTGFKPVTQNQEMTLGWHDAVRSYIADNGSVDELTAFDDTVKERGVLAALSDAIAGGDDEKLGEAMAFVSSMGAVNWAARTQGGLNPVVSGPLSGGELGSFHKARNHIIAQLRYYDPEEVDEVINAMSRYGLNLEQTPDGLLQSDGTIAKVAENRRNHRAAWLEDPEVTKARGGEVADGDVRLYGAYDETSDTVRWSNERISPTTTNKRNNTSKVMFEGKAINLDDVLEVQARRQAVRDRVIDPTSPTFGDDIAAQNREIDELTDLIDRMQDARAKNPVVEGPGMDVLDDDPFFVDVNLDEFGASADHVIANAQDFGDKVGRRYRLANGNRARLSQVDEVGRYDQEKLEGLRALVQQHNDRRLETMAALMANVNPALIRQSVYEALPTFGKWTDFGDSIAEIRHAQTQGLLDDAVLSPVITESGRRASVNPAYATASGSRKWADEMNHLLISLGNDPEARARIMESTFAPLVREMDPSVQRLTVAKVDTASKQEALSFNLVVNSHLKRVEDTKRFFSMHSDLFAQIDDELATFGVQPALGGIEQTSGLRKSVAAVVASVASGRAIAGKGELRLRRLVHWALKEGVSMGDIQRALDDETARLLGLQADRWGRYRVAEQVGMDISDPTARLAAKMKELRAQANYIAADVAAPDSLAGFLGERGYKLVYGVNFAAPEDLMGVMPAIEDVHQANIRSTRIQSFFGRKDPDYVNEMKNRVIKSSLIAAAGKSKAAGKDIRNLDLADDVSVNRLITDLHEILDSAQETARTTLEAADGIVARTGARVATSQIPFDLTRLPSAMSRRKFERLVTGYGYTNDEAFAIYEGLMRAQSLGFKEQGLYAIESTLRSRNNVVEGLRLLGRHEASNKFVGAGNRAAATAGFFGGGFAVGMQDGEGIRPEEFMLGGAAGLMGAHALGRWKGGLQHGGAGSKGLFNRAADSLESSKFAQWGYLADNLANMRDRVRFSLSPVFDASRYSEAVILSQIGEMPPGLTNLRMNQSPTGARRAIRAGIAAESGKTGRALDDAVSAVWDENRARFAAAARNDFEMETIDSIGRRFSSVGVLGFSPVGWMESTFYHLTAAGVDNRKAYETVRDIYTYGTTGRSSAELSMNFVFFPFSFTKKVVGHLGGFFGQDLGRLILIQDSLATYQALNEHYDLSSEFRDRLPILNRMNRMNVLAYGFSPGRFGGVNAPMIGAARNVEALGDLYIGPEIDEITNLFVPQQVTMNNSADADEVWGMMKQVLPAMNDVNQLLNDMFEQGRVVASESHLTTQAEQRRGWEEWRAFQDSLRPQLASMGMTWAQAMNRPEFSMYVKGKRAEIGTAFPTWKQAVGDGIAHSAAIDLELQERLMHPKGEEDYQLALFVNDFNGISEALSTVGLSMSNPEEIPGEVFDVMRKRAIELSRQDPKFKRLYDRFYRRLFGDISTELV